MKSETRFYICIACLIILFDVAGSLASRWFHFDYANLRWLFRCLYAGCGYFGFAYRRLLGGILAGLVAGLTDATVGWLVLVAIGPYLPFAQPHPSVALIVTVVVGVSLYGAF